MSCLVHCCYCTVSILIFDINHRTHQSFTCIALFICIVAFLFFSLCSHPLIIFMMMLRTVYAKNILLILLWLSCTNDAIGLLQIKKIFPFWCDSVCCILLVGLFPLFLLHFAFNPPRCKRDNLIISFSVHLWVPAEELALIYLVSFSFTGRRPC